MVVGVVVVLISFRKDCEERRLASIIHDQYPPLVEGFPVLQLTNRRYSRPSGQTC